MDCRLSLRRSPLRRDHSDRNVQETKLADANSPFNATNPSNWKRRMFVDEMLDMGVYVGGEFAGDWE